MVKIWDWNPLRQLSVLKGLLSNLTGWDPLSIVHQRRFLNLTNVFSGPALFDFFRELVAPVRVLFGGSVAVIGRLRMPTRTIDAE